MSEVEKQCFEFVSNLQFDFYSLNGQASRQKSLMIVDQKPNVWGSLINKLQGDTQPVDQSAQLQAINQSFFGPLIKNRSAAPAQQPAAAEEEYCLMSNSGDESMQSSEEDALNFGMENEPRRKQATNKLKMTKAEQPKEETKRDLMDDQDSLGAGVQKPAEYYRQLERDNRIRDIMISKRFELLKLANPKAKNMKIQRTRFWGELPQVDSQMQIDRDFVRFKHQQQVLPKKPVIRPFVVEPVINTNDDRQPTPFKTKYGSLCLSSAQPNVNFKIDDIEEYEYVQRQRAFLYDPLHIKNSTQFKSFCTQVGFESLGQGTLEKSQVQRQFDKNKAVQSLLHDFEKKDKSTNDGFATLGATPAIQEVFKSIGLKVEEPPAVAEHIHAKNHE